MTSRARPAPPIITLLTDFGTQDIYVGVMKGVILSICPQARLVDLSHAVPPQSVAIGAWFLRAAVEYFPAGTVHLAVVDPGVGSERAPIAVVTERGHLVGPDNGLLHAAAQALGIREVRALENAELFRRPVSQTFHGRDIFAPVAAHLAAGMSPEGLGTALPGLAALPSPAPRREQNSIHGEVIFADRFGNLITNVPAELVAQLSPAGASVDAGTVSGLPIVAAYAAVPPGSALALIGSWGLLEVAVRDGSAAEQLKIPVGAPVVVRSSHGA